MDKLWYVKYREHGQQSTVIAGAFNSDVAAENYCSKLRAGAGGLFGLYHDIYVTDERISNKRKLNVDK